MNRLKLDATPPARLQIALILVAALLFGWGLENLKVFIFDEFHYVPAVKELLTGVLARNTEHPPLGKWFISLGVALFGDRPLGWRIMSLVAGLLTLQAILLLSHRLWRSPFITFWIGVLSLTNFVLFIQSRVAMLDSFLVMFLAWSWVFLVAFAQDQKRDPRNWYAACAAFGFALASKWAGFLMAPIVFGLPLALTYLEAKTFKKILTKSYLKFLAKGAGLFVGAYLLTFVPYIFLEHAPKITLFGLIPFQKDMWAAQLRVVQSHPYQSKWWEWPTLIRPIWYTFEREVAPIGPGIRGVFLLGNPWLLWTGLIAFFTTLLPRFRAPKEFQILTLSYAMLTFGWAVFPRKLSFFYYYYPAIMLLPFFLGVLFFGVPKAAPAKVAPLKLSRVRVIAASAYLVGAVALFVWFYPILAGSWVPNDAFRQWTWFRRWI